MALTTPDTSTTNYRHTNHTGIVVDSETVVRLTPSGRTIQVKYYLNPYINIILLFSGNVKRENTD